MVKGHQAGELSRHTACALLLERADRHMFAVHVVACARRDERRSALRALEQQHMNKHPRRRFRSLHFRKSLLFHVNIVQTIKLSNHTGVK
jgi:hypothetical protein